MTTSQSDVRAGSKRRSEGEGESMTPTKKRRLKSESEGASEAPVVDTAPRNSPPVSGAGELAAIRLDPPGIEGMQRLALCSMEEMAECAHRLPTSEMRPKFFNLTDDPPPKMPTHIYFRPASMNGFGRHVAEDINCVAVLNLAGRQVLWPPEFWRVYRLFAWRVALVDKSLVAMRKDLKHLDDELTAQLLGSPLPTMLPSGIPIVDALSVLRSTRRYFPIRDATMELVVGVLNRALARAGKKAREAVLLHTSDITGQRPPSGGKGRILIVPFESEGRVCWTAVIFDAASGDMTIFSCAKRRVLREWLETDAFVYESYDAFEETDEDWLKCMSLIVRDVLEVSNEHFIALVLRYMLTGAD